MTINNRGRVWKEIILMKNASRAFVQRIAKKPAILLVVVLLAAVACGVFVIRRTHAASLGFGKSTTATSIPARSGPAAPAGQLPSTFKPVVTTSVANGISAAARDLPVTKN